MPSPIRVLHVDDQPSFGELVAEFLEREKERIEVLTETNPKDAFERLSEDPSRIDCFVSDHDMPGKTGIELLEDVRSEYPNLPFILYTGKGSEEIASEAISAGVTDYLQKGSDASQYTVLANRIENAVSQYRTKQEAEQTRKRLSLFFEQSPLGVIEWDEQFTCKRLNKKATEILGYSESELEDKSWRAVVPESDSDPVERVVSQLLEAQGGYHSVNENRRKDGEHIICEWHNRVVTDDDDSVVAIFSQFQEITERREQNRELEEKNVLLSTLFEALPVGVLVEDESRNVLAANQQLFQLFDFPGEPTDIHGKDCEKLAKQVSNSFAEPKDFIIQIEQAIKKGSPYADKEFTLEDGRVLKQSYRPIALPDGPGHLWLYRTERSPIE